MFFLLFGSSGAGKTSVLGKLRGRVADLVLHDFDEIEVPAGADTAWRHRAEEQWVRRALDYEARGDDLLLAGQAPLGELLAAPSAPRLEAISACLLDCDDATRIERLHARGSQWLERAGAGLQDYLNWAAWMREHASDPSSRPEVIKHQATLNEMRWSRWEGWPIDDPRWRVHVIDTSALPVEGVADEVVEWINAETELFRSGAHPLARR
ncbi:MAG TPA: hypothetical protein VE985_06280 [Gaiellaceae bacterium]|nr:hypothetical protein [Gaiellaceae bacterium]